MHSAAVVQRVRSEFIEMPGMQLTVRQATRLWNLDTDDCRSVIDTLVERGFLAWTPRHTVVRAGDGDGGRADRLARDGVPRFCP